MIPWISFSSIFPAISGGVSTLSDIMFLAKKEFDGKLRKTEGNKGTTGVLATLTANTGKDMYIARAKYVFAIDNTFAMESVLDKVELQINWTVVETALFSSFSNSSDAGVGSMEYEFKDIGHKVIAGQIIKLQVITLDSGVQVEGFVECWEEDTGTDPSI